MSDDYRRHHYQPPRQLMGPGINQLRAASIAHPSRTRLARTLLPFARVVVCFVSNFSFVLLRFQPRSTSIRPPTGNAVNHR